MSTLLPKSKYPMEMLYVLIEHTLLYVQFIREIARERFKILRLRQHFNRFKFDKSSSKANQVKTLSWSLRIPGDQTKLC